MDDLAGHASPSMSRDGIGSGGRHRENSVGEGRPETGRAMLFERLGPEAFLPQPALISTQAAAIASMLGSTPRRPELARQGRAGKSVIWSRRRTRKWSIVTPTADAISIWVAPRAWSERTASTCSAESKGRGVMAGDPRQRRREEGDMPDREVVDPTGPAAAWKHQLRPAARIRDERDRQIAAGRPVESGGRVGLEREREAERRVDDDLDRGIPRGCERRPGAACSEAAPLAGRRVPAGGGADDPRAGRGCQTELGRGPIHRVGIPPEKRREGADLAGDDPAVGALVVHHVKPFPANPKGVDVSLEGDAVPADAIAIGVGEQVHLLEERDEFPPLLQRGAFEPGGRLGIPDRRDRLGVVDPARTIAAEEPQGGRCWLRAACHLEGSLPVRSWRPILGAAPRDLNLGVFCRRAPPSTRGARGCPRSGDPLAVLFRPV